MNNFEFDYLLLVGMDDNYQLSDIWKITVEQARSISIEEKKHDRWRTSQSKIKKIGEHLTYFSDQVLG